jgi:hypothetical protein
MSSYRHTAPGSRVIPLHQPGPAIQTVELDAPSLLSMDETCRRLTALKVPYDRLTDFHLKIGQINHYPTTGVTMLDGKKKYAEKGFDVLLQVLRERHVLRSPTPATKAASSSNSDDDAPIVLKAD